MNQNLKLSLYLLRIYTLNDIHQYYFNASSGAAFPYETNPYPSHISYGYQELRVGVVG